MRAKVIKRFPISNTEHLEVGTIVNVANGYCKSDGYMFLCELEDYRQIEVKADCLEVIDYSAYINWEQRRYELAKAAMQGILSNDNSQITAINPNDDKEYHTGIAQYAVACADALINELKNK